MPHINLSSFISQLPTMKRYYQDPPDMERINMANVLMLLSRGSDKPSQPDAVHRVFECKTCNRQFNSYQALGGHRAGHKKPRVSDHHESQEQGQSKPKVHECSICGLEFAIGQALGGHMRRHRAANEGLGHHGFVEKKSNHGKRVVLFDLNMPPCDDDDDQMECRRLGLGRELVEKASMVDCFQ